MINSIFIVLGVIIIAFGIFTISKNREQPYIELSIWAVSIIFGLLMIWVGVM